MIIYCPVCARNIEPSNVDEVESGAHHSFVYVHDDVEHDDSDIEALNTGVQ